MIEPILFLHILFAAIAVLGGLGSRTFLTSLVTGIFTGLLHGGMIALVGAQKGKFEISELPYLNIATDYVMSNAGAYLTFPDARYTVYLVLCGLVLLAVTVVCWFVRFILCSIVCAMLPKKESDEPAIMAAPAPANPSIPPVGAVTPLSPAPAASNVTPISSIAPISPIPPEKPES